MPTIAHIEKHITVSESVRDIVIGMADGLTVPFALAAGLSAGEPLRTVVGAITVDRDRWVEFMMRFELGLERPDPKRAPVSAATIAVSYLLPGLFG